MKSWNKVGYNSMITIWNKMQLNIFYIFDNCHLTDNEQIFVSAPRITCINSYLIFSNVQNTQKFDLINTLKFQSFDLASW